MIYPKKMTADRFREVAKESGAGYAMDLLLLVGPDNIDCDYDDMMKELNQMLKEEG